MELARTSVTLPQRFPTRPICSWRASSIKHSGEVRFCRGLLGRPKMAKIYRLQLKDGRSGVSYPLHATSAGHFAALPLYQIRIRFSVLTQMFARISFPHWFTRCSPFLLSPLRVEMGLLCSKFLPFLTTQWLAQTRASPMLLGRCPTRP